MAVFPDKRLASIAVALSKIALLHDLSKHLATDATVAFDVLDAVSELTEETQAFLSTFLLEHGLPALLTEEISAYVRQEGAQAA